MAKEVSAPPELIKAADVALDENMKPRQAVDLLFYLIITRAIDRHKGNRSMAAKSLGMPIGHFNVKLTLLEAKLA